MVVTWVSPALLRQFCVIMSEDLEAERADLLLGQAVLRGRSRCDRDDHIFAAEHTSDRCGKESKDATESGLLGVRRAVGVLDYEGDKGQGTPQGYGVPSYRAICLDVRCGSLSCRNAYVNGNTKHPLL